MKRMACVLALAAGAGLGLGAAAQPALAAPNPASVANGLKLTVNPPNTAAADTPVGMDVNFRGSRIASVEIYLDGSRIARQTINTLDAHGMIHFTLPESLITEGTHEVMVQAYDRDGNIATGTTRFKVAPREQDALARFTTPRRNATVKDVLPVTVQLDADLKDCYVIFFVDDVFLEARNYSPYTYNLETKKLTNGLHTIKVEVYDDKLSAIKTLSLPISILNPGGLTNRKSIPDDLRTPARAITTSDADIVRTEAETAAPSDARALADPNSQLARTTMSFASGTRRVVSSTVHNSSNPYSALVAETIAVAQPSAALAHAASEPLSPMRAAGPPDSRSITLNSAFAVPDAERLNPVVPRTTMMAPGIPGVLSNPAEIVALGTMTRASALARQALVPMHSDTVARRPRTALGAFVESSPASVRVAHTGSRSMMNLHVKTFAVAFDSTRIAFDVPPRVEHGLPLAPFRAIFEHTGGTVQWFSDSKTVRAVNSAREIDIRIGDRNAKVNNETVKMAATPYIDRGRTIVPLSFVKDAMGVNIQYDARTGHMLIESNW